MKLLNKIFQKKSVKEEKLDILDNQKMPQHIAIIMDGNGRWAKMRGLPRTAGHKAGVEALRDIIRTCSELKVNYLTLYAFSTENWKRPEDEVSALMQLLVYFLRKEINELNENNVKIRTLGDITKLPEAASHEILSAIKLTEKNNGLTVNIALNYGGRDEILKAVKDICTEVMNKKIAIHDINEKFFEQYLYTKDIPDPDLIIRPSGELRISNFLLWQGAYSELWFSNIFWPDFCRDHLIRAILDYQKRNRRFGGIDQRR